MSALKPSAEIVGDARSMSAELRAARDRWILEAYKSGATRTQISRALGVGYDSTLRNLRRLGLGRPSGQLSSANLHNMGLRVGSTGEMFDDMPEPARDQLMRLAAKGRGTIAAALADHFLKSFVEDRA